MRLRRLGVGEPWGRLRHAALVVGHPGHELKVFGWMAQYRPRVHCITDGSGQLGISRLPATEAVLKSAGAKSGELFGCISDDGMYRAILGQERAFFVQLVDQLARSFVEDEVDLVVADASEGFNPTHDICRVLVNAAVVIAERNGGRRITNLAVALAEGELSLETKHDSSCRHFVLDDLLLKRKLEAAANYKEMRAEVQRALTHLGAEYFRTECMRETMQVSTARPAVPFYENWGERRVREGKYAEVIRLREHMLPIMAHVMDHAGQARACIRPAIMPPAITPPDEDTAGICES